MIKGLKHIITLAITLMVIPCFSQNHKIGFAGGVSLYNGDLSHHNPMYSLEEMNAAYAFSYDYMLNKHLQVGLSYMVTKLEGSDSYSNNQAFAERDLSFYTDISEVSSNLQFHFFPILDVSTKLISPYIHAGIGVFRFNPKTSLDGVEYDLQKYSTEGQGLPGNDTSPYQLIDVNYQLGLGIDFKLSSKFGISLSSSIRLLETDYLDDVSGNYYNLNKLSSYKGEMAARLAFKGEGFPNDYPETLHDKPRGNAANNDSYVVHQVKFYYCF